MDILIRLRDYHRDGNDTPDAIAKEAFNHAKIEYNDNVKSSSDAHLHEPNFETESAAEELKLIDGAVNPDEIIKIAKGWNAAVSAKLDKALDKAAKELVGPDGKPKTWLDAAGLTRHEIFKAAAALDDQFFAYADTMLYVTKYEYFTTLLQADELAHIEQHPEEYVQITVCPK